MNAASSSRSSSTGAVAATAFLDAARVLQDGEELIACVQNFLEGHTAGIYPYPPLLGDCHLPDPRRPREMYMGISTELYPHTPPMAGEGLGGCSPPGEVDMDTFQLHKRCRG